MTPAGLRGVVAALCTTLVGLGLARFAYTPLIPALIGAHWFTPDQAVYLGAGNIAGYLAGAAGARAVAGIVGVRNALRGFMLCAAASFVACAEPAGFAWFLLWRLAAGYAGAGLVVLAAPRVLPLVPERHRGVASGLIFTGIGVGIAASGTLLPLLLRSGLTAAWLALGGVSLFLTAITWTFLPPDPVAPAGKPDARQAGIPLSRSLAALCAAYAFSAMGQVPTILFLADFVARGLGHGVAAGAQIWAIYGAGALVGPLAAGMAADRFGGVTSLRALWVMQIMACLALASTPGDGTIEVSSFVLGAGVPGLVVLVLGRSQVLAGAAPESRQRAWSFATIAFALGQAISAYGLSYIFARSEQYAWLFTFGAAAMAVAFASGEVSARSAA